MRNPSGLIGGSQLLLLACVLATSSASATCRHQALGGAAAWARTPRLFHAWLPNGPHDDSDDWHWTRTVDLGDRKPTTVEYSVTHMGNGTIRIKNLFLRVWREHRGEGFIYKPAAFDVDLVPLGKWPFCTLVVSGIVALIDDENDDVQSFLRLDRARLSYAYDPKSAKFHRTFGWAPIALEKIDLSDP
jgi:hypothetical protein